jgi:glycine/D-amino acid oxidase-like deaminating enzyme
MDFPILVVGQGLAGSVLALALAEHGIPCHLADKAGLAISSRVAAGLYNPIVFKRLTEGWRAEEAVLTARLFYSGAEKYLGLNFLNDDGIYRIHGSADEVKLWEKRRDEGWSKHLGQSEGPAFKPWLNAPFGGAVVYSGGHIQTIPFLDAVREAFLTKDSFFETYVNPKEIDESENGVVWSSQYYRAVVFCEGAAVEQNLFFETPLLRPAKGEILVIEAADVPQEVFNGKVYGVPLGNSQFKVGATYEWDALHAEPTPQKYEELVQQLSNLLKVPFKVIRHDAGIRPSTPTRRPLFMRSKRNQNVYTFNGLGTKGVLLAPMLAKEIALFFKNQKPVHPEFGRNLQE